MTRILFDSKEMQLSSVPVFEKGTGIFLGVLNLEEEQLQGRVFRAEIQEQYAYVDMLDDSCAVPVSVAEFDIVKVRQPYGGGTQKHLFCTYGVWESFVPVYRSDNNKHVFLRTN